MHWCVYETDGNSSVSRQRLNHFWVSTKLFLDRILAEFASTPQWRYKGHMSGLTRSPLVRVALIRNGLIYFFNFTNFPLQGVGCVEMWTQWSDCRLLQLLLTWPVSALGTDHLGSPHLFLFIIQIWIYWFTITATLKTVHQQALDTAHWVKGG